MTDTNHSSIYFITGNQNKADYLAKYLGVPIRQQKVDLDELQTLDIKEIVEHKVRQAYDIVKQPVIVEDVALTFHAMGKLPGPFIKFFEHEMTQEEICRLVDGKDRAATATCVYGYYDGKDLELFKGSMAGKVAEHPAGDNGYGFDRFFSPEGYDTTRAELNDEEYQKVYLTIKPIKQVAAYLKSKHPELTRG